MVTAPLATSVTAGAAQWVAGQIGQALQCNGTSVYVDCGKGASLNITEALTITAWIKMDFTGGDRKIAGNQDNKTGGYKLGVYSNNFVELERAREKFNFTYLPEESEKLFREALGCYSAGHFNAFASMCRRTAQAVFRDLGENGRLRIFNQINEAREMAEIDADTFAVVKKALFGSDADAWPSTPELGAYEAGVLLELVKDMLYQAYVRKGKLQQAMMVRRFFAEETLDKITPIGRAAGAE